MLSKRLFVLTIAIFCVMSLSVAFAKSSSKLTRQDLIEVLNDQADGGNEVSEAVENTSGEELVSGEAVEAESGEAVESGEAEEPTSGEAVEAESGEEPVSGEVAEEVSGEAVESGEEATEAVSGEVLVVSGEEVSGEPAELIEPEEIKAKDVEESRWYAPYVNDALQNGIMGLDEEGNFRPNEVVTKGDVIDAIYNLPGKSSGEEVDWAIENGIISEDEDIDEEASREEVAVLIYNYVKSNGGGFKGTWVFLLGYDDDEDISEEAYEAVAWCTMNDIIVGKTDDIMDPQAMATRAQLATIMVRLNASV